MIVIDKQTGKIENRPVRVKPEADPQTPAEKTEALLNAVENLLLNAWPTEEAFNPSSYELAAEPLLKLRDAYQNLSEE